MHAHHGMCVHKCAHIRGHARTHTRAHAHTHILLYIYITTINVIKYLHCHINSITYSFCTNIWSISACPDIPGAMIRMRRVAPGATHLRVQLVTPFCAEPKWKSWHFVANLGRCKFCQLSLYSNPRGSKINLRSLFSNPGGCKWVKIVKKAILKGCKACIISLDNYIKTYKKSELDWYSIKYII